VSLMSRSNSSRSNLAVVLQFDFASAILPSSFFVRMHGVYEADATSSIWAARYIAFNVQ